MIAAQKHHWLGPHRLGHHQLGSAGRSASTAGASRSVTSVIAPIIVLTAFASTACTTVKLEGGDKPIEVNLNVKIDQEVRVKLDQEIEDLISDNPDIF